MKRQVVQSSLDMFVKRPKVTVEHLRDLCEGETAAQTPQISDNDIETELTETVNLVKADEGCSTFSNATTSESSDHSNSPINNNLTSGSVSERNDIGHYIDSIYTVDDKTKCDLIENPWKPFSGYKFPFSTHKKKGKEEKRYLNQSHLDSYSSWLVYSPAKNGLFCKYCTLFVTAGMGGSHKHVPLQKLVTQPITVFANLLGKDGDLCSHERQQYHRDAVDSAKNFLKTCYEPHDNIMNQINSQRLHQVQENRQRLKPIIESILFLGRQNIALRGHRDDGKLHCDSFSLTERIEEPLINEGNFRELLRYRVNSGDTQLENHLKNSSSNATYISKSTQNELIACCAEEIKFKILQRIKEAKYYCIMFDETTDISHTSQLSLCISYVHNSSRHEDFIAFVDVHEKCFGNLAPSFEPRVTGKVLGELVLKEMQDLNLDPLHCVGIGTDGCSLMISEQQGAVAEIKKMAINASRCMCFNHALNLSISKTSSVQSIRNSIGIMKEVVSFFNASAKRNHILFHVLHAQLKGMCETRWVERTEALTQFCDELIKVTQALEYISEWNDTTSSSKAKTLLLAIHNVEFVVTLHCQLSLFSYSAPLSRLFQKKTLDLSCAANLVTDLLTILNNQRINCDEEFSVIFAKASDVLSKLDVAIEMPRISQKKQIYRVNIPCSTPEEYYKKAIYIPMLDSVMCDLQSRFSDETLSCCTLTSLLPKNILTLDSESLTSTVKIISKTYGALISEKYGSEYVMLAEIQLWKEKWSRSLKNTNIPLPNSVEHALQNCDEDLYPAVNSLLTILLTLPVSVASAERSFSSLRRMKTWLRSQMGQERLTGLALLHAHRDITVDVNKVIDRFAKSGNRRKDFVL